MVTFNILSEIHMFCGMDVFLKSLVWELSHTLYCSLDFVFSAIDQDVLNVLVSLTIFLISVFSFQFFSVILYFSNTSLFKASRLSPSTSEVVISHSQNTRFKLNYISNFLMTKYHYVFCIISFLKARLLIIFIIFLLHALVRQKIC